MVTEETIDTAEAAARLGVSVITMKRWRRNNSGPPFVRVGPRRIRYRVKEIDRWLDEGSSHQS